MRLPSFVAADATRHHDALLEINLEYMAWVFSEIERAFGVHGPDLLGRPVADYTAAALPRICADTAPKGVFYLVYLGETLAAMGGLRRLQPGRAELKRIYVRPAFRGRRLGETVLGRLMSDAQAFGYARLCLDSAPFMGAAQALYERHGFTDVPAYPETEVPEALRSGWRFMQVSTSARSGRSLP